MLNPVLSILNFREHSLYSQFLEEAIEDEDEFIELSEYTQYEQFLTWLEDN